MFTNFFSHFTSVNLAVISSARNNMKILLLNFEFKQPLHSMSKDKIKIKINQDVGHMHVTLKAGVTCICTNGISDE